MKTLQEQTQAFFEKCDKLYEERCKLHDRAGALMRRYVEANDNRINFDDNEMIEIDEWNGDVCHYITNDNGYIEVIGEYGQYDFAYLPINIKTELVKAASVKIL